MRHEGPKGRGVGGGGGGVGYCHMFLNWRCSALEGIDFRVLLLTVNTIFMF